MGKRAAPLGLWNNFDLMGKWVYIYIRTQCNYNTKESIKLCFLCFFLGPPYFSPSERSDSITIPPSPKRDQEKGLIQSHSISVFFDFVLTHILVETVSETLIRRLKNPMSSIRVSVACGESEWPV